MDYLCIPYYINLWRVPSGVCPLVLEMSACLARTKPWQNSSLLSHYIPSEVAARFQPPRKRAPVRRCALEPLTTVFVSQAGFVPQARLSQAVLMQACLRAARNAARRALPRRS